ncbi:PepSY-like domain-containing protein [Olleya marilimosa]|uniref:PepSY-like domain-containing protein n=1 Tax=Olleya marilimosa TaxID=272164 RepID=UPI000481EB50|nr:PepSY-like domain-containing protein [Olleya marilimosa]
MKTLKVILGAFLVTTIFAFASGGDKAPQKVKEAFAKKFPTAKKVKWEKENATEWEAEFKMNKVEYSANFLEDGTWKETEHEIEEKDIPQNVKTVLATKFPGYEMEEVEISETKDGMVYEFEIEKGESNMEVVIDTNGKIVKQEVKKEDDKEDKD